MPATKAPQPSFGGLPMAPAIVEMRITWTMAEKIEATPPRFTQKKGLTNLNQWMVISRFLDDEWLHSKHFKTHTFPATNCCIPAFWDFSAGIFSREPFSAAWSNRETPLKHPACVTFTIWEVCSMSGQATCLFISHRANSEIYCPNTFISYHTQLIWAILKLEFSFLRHPFAATYANITGTKHPENKTWTRAYINSPNRCSRWNTTKVEPWPSITPRYLPPSWQLYASGCRVLHLGPTSGWCTKQLCQLNFLHRTIPDSYIYIHIYNCSHHIITIITAHNCAWYRQ